MNTTNQAGTIASANTIDTAKAIRNLYFTRVIFSVIWVILISIYSKSNNSIANILFIIYPLWDVIATYFDIKANPSYINKTPQYINIAIGILTTVGVILALQKGIPGALIVFGIWAIVAGAIQLILGLRRRKALGGQWPMIISGGQSMLAGTSFIWLAPSSGISTLAGYSAFGAFYFLLAAIRLSRTMHAQNSL